MIRTRVVVSGWVQGVFFRDTCQRMARQHGVRGWVRNLPDGRRVEAVFEGDPEQVARLVGWARQGPDGAEVADVRTYRERPEGLAGFTIRPTPRG